MEVSSSFKAAFLKHMLMGLKLGGVYSASTSMSIEERKRVIKLSADVALAFARGRTIWTRALVTDLSSREEDKALVWSILGSESKRFTKKFNRHSIKILMSRKILRRSFRARSRIRKGSHTSVVAKAEVKKRTELLKRLVPGGDSLDGISLFGETLDYAIYLQAQVNLMQRIAQTFGASNIKRENIQRLANEFIRWEPTELQSQWKNHLQVSTTSCSTKFYQDVQPVLPKSHTWS